MAVSLVAKRHAPVADLLAMHSCILALTAAPLARPFDRSPDGPPTCAASGRGRSSQCAITAVCSKRTQLAAPTQAAMAGLAWSYTPNAPQRRRSTRWPKERERHAARFSSSASHWAHPTRCVRSVIAATRSGSRRAGVHAGCCAQQACLQHSLVRAHGRHLVENFVVLPGEKFRRHLLLQFAHRYLHARTPARVAGAARAARRLYEVATRSNTVGKMGVLIGHPLYHHRDLSWR
jgi:hypothetical protein